MFVNFVLLTFLCRTFSFSARMLNFSFPYICWKFIFHSYDELFWRWFYICGLFSFANGRMLENSQQINALQNVQLLSFFPLNLSPNSFQFLNTELRLVEKLLARFVICTWVIPPPPSMCLVLHLEYLETSISGCQVGGGVSEVVSVVDEV